VRCDQLPIGAHSKEEVSVLDDAVA
jgi:hypothetical protein